MIQDNMPLLKRSANVTTKDGNVVIQFLGDEITLEGNAAALFSKLAPRLDGKTSIARIAEETSEAAARISGLTKKLSEVGIVSFEGSANGAYSLTGKEFYALHRKYCSHWLQDIYVHPLWERMVNGTASRAQVIGFAFEKYHYIEGAYEHMAIAASNATPEMMPHLAEHFIEEYTHGDIYRKGLRSLFPDDVVLSSQPLPSTRALVNYLSESAARNSFGYYAGNEVLQMTENTSDESADGSINTFYDAMRKHYPYTNKLIDSFIAHTNADQNLGHENAFVKMCDSVPPMSKSEVQDAMNIARNMVEHLRLFMDGIDVHYANFPIVPRVPCNLLSE